MEAFFLGTPFVFAWVLAKQGSDGVVILLIFLMVPITVGWFWVRATLATSDEIWPPDEDWKPRFREVW